MTTTLAPTLPATMPTPSGHPAPRAGVRTTVADSLVFCRRNLEHIRQIPEKLLDVTMQPLMFVLLFTYVFGGAIAVTGGSYREYIIGGILIQTLAFGLVGPATSIATDMTEGVIDRFRSLPTSNRAYLIGHYLAELAGMALSIAITLGTGLIVGWRTHQDVLHVTAAVALVLVFASAMIWVGTWIGLLVRSPDAVMGVAFVMVFPVTFLSNAFVPIDSLPNALQWVATWNPVSVIVRAVRDLFGNPVTPNPKAAWPIEHPVPAGFLYCLVILAFAVPGAVRTYGRRTAD